MDRGANVKLTFKSKENYYSLCVLVAGTMLVCHTGESSIQRALEAIAR